MTFKDHVSSLLKAPITEQQLAQFDIYFHELIEYNKITNLTSITDEQEVYFKHFYDSLTLAKTIDIYKISSLCDMGAGAGFPSIPLKIMYPHLEITIVDSLNKRIQFLKQLIYKLDLADVECIHERVEIFAKNHQSYFDLVTARALGHLHLITEMAIPMVKDDGLFVPLKGAQFQDEIDQSIHAIKHLKSSVESIDAFELPYHLGMRANIVIRKHNHITGFPRPYHIMIKKPL